MRQKMFSIGDDFNIENEQGERCLKVDGKSLRIRKTLVFEAPDGRELYKIQERMLRVKDTMAIEDADGNHAATVKKALITPLRERFVVKIEGGSDLDIKGNIVDHEYRLERGRDTVATVSKKWFAIRDTYGVEIGPGENHPLILAVAVALDQIAHPAR